MKVRGILVRRIGSLGDLQLLVEPKIPREHLLYLFSKSGAVPRLAEDSSVVNIGLLQFGRLHRVIMAHRWGRVSP